MSFAFTVDKDSWETDNVAKTEVRTINHIDAVVDVSPVDFPAYDGTSVEARDNKGMIESLESREKESELRKKLIVETFL